MADANAAYVVSDGEKALIDKLREIGQTRRLPAEIDLATLVRETHSAGVRHAAALALLDLGDPRTAELLIELIARKDTERHRGTLLFVLNELHASVPLDILIDVLIAGPYEAREEVLTLLAHARADDPGRVQALARLKPLAGSKDEELAAAASDAIMQLAQ